MMTDVELELIRLARSGRLTMDNTMLGLHYYIDGTKIAFRQVIESMIERGVLTYYPNFDARYFKLFVAGEMK